VKSVIGAASNESTSSAFAVETGSTNCSATFLNLSSVGGAVAASSARASSALTSSFFSAPGFRSAPQCGHFAARWNIHFPHWLHATRSDMSRG
jgi:hypothetical protein